MSAIDPAYLAVDSAAAESDVPEIAAAKQRVQAPRAPRVPKELNRGGALDLVDRSKPSPVATDLPTEMEELYALGDFTGALGIAELILGSAPEDPHARRCAESCRSKLVHFYMSRIGSLTQVPVAALNDAGMRWLGLDHRAGFLLSRIDGVSSVEDILDVSSMPRLEGLKTIAELLERGAIALEQG